MSTFFCILWFVPRPGTIQLEDADFARFTTGPRTDFIQFDELPSGGLVYRRPSANTICCHTVVAKEGVRASERESGMCCAHWFLWPRMAPSIVLGSCKTSFRPVRSILGMLGFESVGFGQIRILLRSAHSLCGEGLTRRAF